MNSPNGKRQTVNTFWSYFCARRELGTGVVVSMSFLTAPRAVVPATAWIIRCALERRRSGLQRNSAKRASGPCLRAANVYPASEPLRELRSKFSLSSYRLRQSSSNRYRCRRGPERDAFGKNDLG